jgi:uncharacterized membrane protein
MMFSKKIAIPLSFTLFLLATRMIITGELTYIFLAWNLFLAWIPFALSRYLVQLSNRKAILFILGVWLLFLPNAPYIITDFLHLKHRLPVPYWYDILLLFSASLNGLLLGLLSLFTVEEFLARFYGKRISSFIILTSFFLCAFGVYVGRYLRWNSWDVFTNPGEIVMQLLDRVFNPLDHFGTWSVTFLFGSFLYVMYYSLKNLFNYKTNQF